MNMNTGVNSTISTDTIISNVKKTRDALIHELLQGENIMSFMEEHYDTLAISPVKLEFLKRDLIELKMQSLDLVYYASVIKQLKEQNRSDVEKNHILFFQEVNSVFKKYGIE